MIKEESFMKKLWSGFLIILLLYTATVMPYNLALVDDDSGNTPTYYIDLVVDGLFLIDIMFNFNTPVLNTEGIPNYDRKIVSKTYIKSWFLIDLVASVPVNLIMKMTIEDNDNIKL